MNVQKVLTGAAQTLLIKTPEEFSTQVTPGEMSMTVGLEVMAHSRLSCLTAGRLDDDAVSNQTNDSEGAGLTCDRRRRSGAGCRSSQLDGIIQTEVLQLDQLTLRHPVLYTHTVMSGQHWCGRAFGSERRRH